MRKAIDLSFDLDELEKTIEEISIRNQVTPLTLAERNTIRSEYIELQRWAQDLPRRANDATRAARCVFEQTGSSEEAERTARRMYPNGRWNAKGVIMAPELLS
jgi:hypothetical protein